MLLILQVVEIFLCPFINHHSFAVCVCVWQDFVGITFLLLINSTISFIEENNAGNAAAALMAHLALKTKVSYIFSSRFFLVLNGLLYNSGNQSTKSSTLSTAIVKIRTRITTIVAQPNYSFKIKQS